MVLDVNRASTCKGKMSSFCAIKLDISARDRRFAHVAESIRSLVVVRDGGSGQAPTALDSGRSEANRDSLLIREIPGKPENEKSVMYIRGAFTRKHLASTCHRRVSWSFADLGVALGVSRKLRSTSGDQSSDDLLGGPKISCSNRLIAGIDTK